MRLTDDRIAVEVLAPETTTSLGIVIRSADERPTEGIVKAIGPGKKNKDGVVIPLTLKVGDKVMFPAGAGLKVTVAGETLSIFKEEEIIAVLGD
jgi:chaperonin GroES